MWFEAEKAERRQGYAGCARSFKQHLIKKVLTSKQILTMDNVNVENEYNTQTGHFPCFSAFIVFPYA